ncbi:MAG: hypothetical protein PHE83_01865 [Opitutaceae bacterium]|nr:hypothetical protein [Opitutaceae bacterium]
MNPTANNLPAESPVGGRPAPTSRAGGSSAWLWVAVALTACKLWLTAGQTLFAIGGATDDDHLALKLAESLLRGEWLGPYNELTLVKGPFYSIWIALVFLLGIPLLQAQQCLYAGACALVARAAAPRLPSDWAKLGLYALLLWNPMSFDARSLGRVLRQDIYPSLALILFAAMIALYIRRGESWRRLAPWAATLGAGWAAFWLTREEGIWIVPSLMLLGAAFLVGAWRHSREARINAGRMAVIAILCAAAPITVVCALNAHYYGWFGSVEFRARAFKDAYGALLRVQPEEEIPLVTVTRATRQRIYAVSPAFAELRPYLEGTTGRDWATNSAEYTHLRPEELEIGGGWFMWALRQSVTDAGHTRDARSALAFYARMAREINQACDDGRLPAGPPRSGFMPPWQAGQTQALASLCVDFADYFASFRDFSASSPASLGTRQELDFFRDLTGARLSHPSQGAMEYALPYHDWLDGWKVGVLQNIGRILRRLLFGLVLVAQGIWLVRAVQLIARRQLTYPCVLAVAAWGGCAACLLVCALVQVTSFPTRSIVYFAPAYPLLLLFVAAVFFDAAAAWWRSRPAASRS